MPDKNQTTITKKQEVHMKKLFIPLCVLLLLVSGTIFATGGEKEPGPGTEGKPFAGQKITVLYFSATYAEAAKEYSAEFTELTGAEVEVVDFPYLNLYEKMALALSTGDDTYDIVTPAAQWDGEFEPFMEDLEPYIKRDNFDTSDFTPQLWEQSGKWANKIMGIPFSNTPQTLSYRTDLIDEFPQTWDAFFEVMDELHDPPNLYAISVPGVKEQFSGLWMMVQWSLDGRWANRDWKLTIDSPETREALRIARKWMEYADPAAPAWTLPEADAAFLQGNAAVCFSWPTLAIAPNGDNPEKSKVVGKWAIAPIPYAKNGVTVLSSWNIGIPKAAKNKDAAWEWIKFYTNAEKQLKNFVDYSILPSRESVWEEPEVKNSKLYPHKAASDQGSVIWWRIPAGTMAETYVRDAVANYITDQWDIEKSVKYMEDGFAKLLADYPPAPGVKNTGR
jgi:ABC-type glycerol-3-phosphate transport system substrate-binding protein